MSAESSSCKTDLLSLQSSRWYKILSEWECIVPLFRYLFHEQLQVPNKYEKSLKWVAEDLLQNPYLLTVGFSLLFHFFGTWFHEHLQVPNKFEKSLRRVTQKSQEVTCLSVTKSLFISRVGSSLLLIRQTDIWKVLTC